MADDRIVEALGDLERFLAAGINVVSSSPVFLQYPEPGDPMAAPLIAAATRAGVSLFVNGVDPGFANDALPLVLSGICERIEEVRCSEVLNYNTYNQPMVLFDIMGFGRDLHDVPMLLAPGVLTMAWGSVVRQIAAGLGVTLTDVTEWYEREPAPEDFEIPAGTIKAGTAAALHFEVRGMVGDKPVIVLEHVTRLRDDLGRGVAAAGRARLLPGPDQRRAELHARSPADGVRRRSQHGRSQGDRDAPRQRRAGRGGGGAGARHRPRPPTGHRAGTRRHLTAGDGVRFNPGGSVDDLAGLQHRGDRGVVGDVGQDVARALGAHGNLQGLGGRELEVHAGHVGAVDALVDLGAVEPPRAHGEGDVLLPVVVVVEGGALGRRGTGR